MVSTQYLKQYLQSILSAARPQLRLYSLQRRALAAPHTHHLSILLRGEYLHSSNHIYVDTMYLYLSILVLSIYII